MAAQNSQSPGAARIRDIPQPRGVIEEAYRRILGMLVDELGIDPGEDLQRLCTLFDAVLHQPRKVGSDGAFPARVKLLRPAGCWTRVTPRES